MRCCWIFLVAVAQAQEAEPEVYEVRAPADARHPGASLATIDVASHVDEQVTVAEVVAELPGLQVRSLGGPGTVSAVSIRGSSPAQVAVYLDGVPLNRGALGSVDLSLFALESLSAVEVWSGLVPVDRMGAGLGGVIELLPRRDHSGGEVSVTGGSFGTRGALVRAGESAGAYAFSGTASYLGSEGDFLYLDHRGTLFNASDDQFTTRQNNGFDQVAGTATAYRAGFLDASFVQDVFYKAQGIAGPLTITTSQAALDTWRSISKLKVGRPGLLETSVYGTFEQSHYGDPENEVGVGAQDQTGQTFAIGGELRGIWPAGLSVLTVVPQIHHERYAQNDNLDASADELSAERLVLGGGISDTLALLHGRLLLEPALRVDHYVDDVVGGEERNQLLVSPRGGVRADVGRGFSVRASGGRYHRAPTFLEMFGDRGYVVGNSDLAAETGSAADAGLGWNGLGWLRADATVHFAEVNDLILFVQNSQQSVRAENIGRARLLGSELALSAERRRWRARASYAFLSPQNLVEPGHDLPGRARHEVYGRAETGPWGIGSVRGSLFSDAELVSGMFFDAANLRAMPARLFWGAGLKITPRRLRELTLSLEVKNLLDAKTETVEINPGGYQATVATQDYLGYALPGRAFYATARIIFWKEMKTR